MQYNEETLNLRDGACTLTIKGFNVADVRALSDEQLFALAEAGVEGWKYRGAVRQNKTDGYVNNGKSFGLADIVADLLASPTRSTGPSKADKERGDDLADRARKAYPMPEIGEEWNGIPLTEETWDISAPEIKAEVHRIRAEWVTAKFAAAKADKPWIEWQWDDTLTLAENCHRVQWAVRQPKPEPKKSTKYI